MLLIVLDFGTDANVERFTNSMGFAAITIAAAGEVEYWSSNGYLKGFLMYFGVPAGLVALNALGVKVTTTLLKERQRNTNGILGLRLDRDIRRVP
jgi:hypothetical protein